MKTDQSPKLDGLRVDGLTVDGLTVDGLTVDGLTVDGLTVDGLTDAAGPLTSWNPARWLTIFGPGAIVASLTIGTGELIFSSRGGAIFGYRILWLFLSISVLKWVLVFSAARHMVLSGVHPLRRWLDIPVGPRGWLPAVMFLFAAVCIPIWVSFHASVIGDLLADLSGTRQGLAGAGIHLWGMLMLAAVAGLSLTGGYAALERVQLMVVGLMLAVVCVALALLRPDWLEMVSGMVIPRCLSFPEWMLADQRPLIRQIASQPVWIETSLYVGVIGGAGFDYLAYVAFLRESVGRAGHTPPATHAGNCSIDQLKLWIRAPLIDCTLSFLIVFVFSAVFVAWATWYWPRRSRFLVMGDFYPTRLNSSLACTPGSIRCMWVVRC